MKCSSCNSDFSLDQIREKRQGLGSPTIKCPKCGIWLAKDKRSQKIQVIGIVLWLVGLSAIIGYIPLNSVLGSSLFAVGIILFLISLKIGTWQPKQTDP